MTTFWKAVSWISVGLFVAGMLFVAYSWFVAGPQIDQQRCTQGYVFKTDGVTRCRP